MRSAAPSRTAPTSSSGSTKRLQLRQQARLGEGLGRQWRHQAARLGGTEADGPSELRSFQAVFASDDPIDCDADNLTYLTWALDRSRRSDTGSSSSARMRCPRRESRIVWETPRTRYFHRYSLNRSPEPERVVAAEPTARGMGGCAVRLAHQQSGRSRGLARDASSPRAHSARTRVGLVVRDLRRERPTRVSSQGAGGCVPSSGILEAVIDGCLAKLHRDDDHGRAALVAAKLVTQLRTPIRMSCCRR